ncbi:meiotic fizzy-related APC coactivator Fzr3 [Schizosaccharomyces pombe]|uniref:Meiotic fizzy-related protein 2 n=1 Tax=Schizosaccharomyces pombe (strain 972 / ATCC 24843) TaxID=284812 RepID=MFR2_SCHPO|nr:Cdc20/Fizzy subfamily WD repeat protein [Schizosaccharomyces pombe]O94411.1 RecName: Full=Meiotic fizzy-related protein 2; AltName: Full=Meiotically up-regulated gene 55 protein [Schizosaccharomyces pombe 972h-]CAA22488.1 Cdc20/Fizzy subfamily WD repeat protein [Schizosaccharomyces pombe]|eukprot:NP_588462.1 Cdc20/Fizzy subfamily WD repeat protein [Schizosaccharomyces pombe]
MIIKKKESFKSPGRLWRVTKIRKLTAAKKNELQNRKCNQASNEEKKILYKSNFLDRFIPSKANSDAFRIMENAFTEKLNTQESLLPDILNLNVKGVLHYKDNKKQKTTRLIESTNYQRQTIHGASSSLVIEVEENGHLSNMQGSLYETPLRILDAPGLLDDFYISPLAWSTNGELAVALAQNVYLWSEISGPSIMELSPTTYEVSSLAYSSDGGFLAIARVNGFVEIWNRKTKNNRCDYKFHHDGDISCMAWSPINWTLLVGGSTGNIYVYRRTKSMMRRVHTIKKVHQEQVCGLEWNYDGTQFASGGNDNLVCIFDIDSLENKKFYWIHLAAVKALAFCPWQKSLLAVGTGSNDQQIYFYDTFRGHRIHSLFCGAQVTSVIWSRRYKEFCYSLGYSPEGTNSSLIVYRWPQLTKVFDIPSAAIDGWGQDLRTIMAIHTHRKYSNNTWEEGEYVVVANSDETVKFYKIWGNEMQEIHNDRVLYREGIFGSHILEMLENIPEQVLTNGVR